MLDQALTERGIARFERFFLSTQLIRPGRRAVLWAQGWRPDVILAHLGETLRQLGTARTTAGGYSLP